MVVKVLKPVTAGRRGMSIVQRFGVLTKIKPNKALTRGAKRQSGRNARGVITVQARGGGAKQRMRQVDLKQSKLGVPATIRSIEYDPKRSSYIALAIFLDGEKTYILAPHDLKVGDRIVYNPNTKVKPGNRLMLKNIPAGIPIHNIELQPGRGGQLVRSAGGAATITSFDKDKALVKMPSGEVRLVPKEAFASVGLLSNPDHSHISFGKAGRRRRMGHRPRVRGKAKNPVDHPHGGGEGGSPIGLKHPKTPTGKPTKGYKTRKKSRSTKHIVKPRGKRRRGR
ncbi:50S ribosomal protein L2 [candidate division Kazan bacterium RBG_13_50_9]|uniref:Large ribosomal subunit protein uL2 n=1 Tax=candidate division Kazan bacterium RBG_13_50_9 TaxID=1798535 RepID=A0A1F4NSV9_UNCK3|nr:MAG: 50S ribosomal protein L2 [candidate division Kazan bacterium RBG_13_50_9]